VAVAVGSELTQFLELRKFFLSIQLLVSPIGGHLFQIKTATATHHCYYSQSSNPFTKANRPFTDENPPLTEKLKFNVTNPLICAS